MYVSLVTQTPKDVHKDVLAQLGSRVQHQLRAFTPDDAEALKATVRTFPTSSYDLEELLTTVGIGEAVVTVMSERGAPTPVAYAMLPAPQSLMAPSAQDMLEGIVAGSPLAPLYAEAMDRESAYEQLTGDIAAGPGAPLNAPPAPAGMTEAERLEQEILVTGQPTVPPPAPELPPAKKPRSRISAPPAGSGGVVETVLGSKASRASCGRPAPPWPARSPAACSAPAVAADPAPPRPSTPPPAIRPAPNDHVHHPGGYATRLARLVGYSFAWWRSPGRVRTRRRGGRGPCRRGLRQSRR